MYTNVYRFRVFRAQLSKENDFIDDIVEDDATEDCGCNDNVPEPDHTQFKFLEGVCEICGWKATKHCAKCKQRW